MLETHCCDMDQPHVLSQQLLHYAAMLISTERYYTPPLSYKLFQLTFVSVAHPILDTSSSLL